MHVHAHKYVHTHAQTHAHRQKCNQIHMHRDTAKKKQRARDFQQEDRQLRYLESHKCFTPQSRSDAHLHHSVPHITLHISCHVTTAKPCISHISFMPCISLPGNMRGSNRTAWSPSSMEQIPSSTWASQSWVPLSRPLLLSHHAVPQTGAVALMKWGCRSPEVMGVLS